MKGIYKSLLIFFVVALVAACSQKPMVKTELPVEQIKKVSSLSRIVVYPGNVPLGENGSLPDGMTINVGGTAYLSAQGRDGDNKPVKIRPTWTASDPELVSITPVGENMVGLKGLKEGEVNVVVEYDGVRRTVEAILIQ